MKGFHSLRDRQRDRERESERIDRGDRDKVGASRRQRERERRINRQTDQLRDR